MNKPKFPNSKQVSIAIVLVCISLIAGALIAQAVTPSTTFWISSGVYPGAPSYTVWAESGSYFAKDSWGHTVYSGTNASEILQNSIDATGSTLNYGHPYNITTNIPKIIITSPLTIDYAITIDYPLILDYGWQTITLNAGFILPSKTSSVTIENGGFKVASGITAFLLTGVQNTVIRNLHLTSSAPATGNMSYAIRIISDATASSNFLKLDTIYISFADIGIQIAGNSVAGYSTEIALDNIQISNSAVAAIDLDYAQSVSLREVTVSDSLNGIRIRGSETIYIENGDLERNIFSHVLFMDSTALPTAASARITFLMCLFGQYDTTNAIQYEGASIRNVGNVRFTQCGFWVDSQPYINNTAHFNHFDFQQVFFGSTGLSFPTLSSVSHRYIGRGFQTEGYYATVSNGDWKAHQLDGIPTSFHITATSDVNVWVASVNITHFQVGVSAGSPNIYYYGEYQP